MKVLFLVPYPTEGASNRIRVEQFIPYLKSKGVVCRIRPFVNRAFYRILYLPHRYFEKTFWFAVCTFNRMLDILRAFSYDVVFIHREAYPFGGPFIESILHMMGKPIVFDFDDAIFLQNTSEHNIYIERFKKPYKVDKILKMSRLVIAGNSYLKEHAIKYNKNVIMIPSAIDTEKYKPATSVPAGREIIIGWIGSSTTKDFLYEMTDVFTALFRKYGGIKLKVVGARLNIPMPERVINKTWRLEEEVDDLRSFDIGVMPMPDNEWTRGKCGFKALLYMACGIPVVVSPVGVNTEIVEEDINGFFGKDATEWIDKLSILIEDKEARRKMGQKGRDKVLDKYSLKTAAPVFYEILRKVYDK